MSRYRIVQRDATPYAAIPVTTTMADLGRDAPPLNGEVFDWIAARPVSPAGPPFWRYDVIDMAGALQLQVGVAITAATEGDDRVVVGALPAGSYLQTTHRGHPDTLAQATADLLAHAAAQGLTFDVAPGPSGERWAARLEFYLTDPDEQPDLDAWQTLLAVKLAG